MTLPTSLGALEHLLFARGYLLWRTSDSRPQVLDRLSWVNRDDLPSQWRLAHSPMLEVNAITSGRTTVLLLGGGVVPETHEAAALEITRWLSEACDDESEFQRRVDAVNGRFAVARIVGESLRLQNDPQGLRAVFHSDLSYRPVVGSHANLVGEAIGAPTNAFARRTFHDETNLRTPPGRHTTRHGVFALLPNAELEMPSRGIRRVFPTSPRHEIPTDAALVAMDDELATGHQLLFRSGVPIYCSLSAGLDSRLTLAYCRGHLSQVKFFTYDIESVQNKANEHDSATAKALAQAFGLDHTVLEVPKNSASADLRRVLGVNRHRAHSPDLAARYMGFFPAGAVHLRSNGNETVTGYYRRSGWTDERAGSPEARMQLASHGRCQDLGVLDAFTEAWQSTQAWRIEHLGYSALDFAYAEDRMGVWHQNIVQETDISAETRVPLGSRKLLKLALSCPPKDQLSGRIIMELIQRRWPETLSLPINGADVSALAGAELWPDEPKANRTFPRY